MLQSEFIYNFLKYNIRDLVDHIIFFANDFKINVWSDGVGVLLIDMKALQSEHYNTEA